MLPAFATEEITQKRPDLLTEINAGRKMIGGSNLVGAKRIVKRITSRDTCPDCIT